MLAKKDHDAIKTRTKQLPPIVSIILRYDLLNRYELKDAFYSALKAEERRQSARSQDAGRWEIIVCLAKAYLTSTPVVVSDVCVMSVSSESTVKRQLRELVHLGVADKIPDGNDRRRHFVTLKQPYLNALIDFVKDCDEEFKDLIEHHDKKERRESKIALRKTEDRLRAITDALPDLVFLFDEDGRYLEVMANSPELLIQESSILVGKTLHQVLPARYANKFLKVIQTTLNTGQPQSIEYSLDVPNGFSFFDGRLAPVTTSSDEKDQVVFVARDITDRKRAEFRLEESEKRFRDYTDMSVDWFWEMDEELRFTEFSSGMNKAVGIDKSFFIGKTRRELIADKNADDPQIKKHLEDLDAHRGFENFVYCYKSPSQEDHYARVSGRPLYDDQGNFAGYRGTTSDVTEQIRAEQTIRENLSFTERIISHSPIGIGIYESSGQCVSVNKSYANILGATPKQVLALNYHKIESWKASGLYDAAIKATLDKIEIRREVKMKTTFGKEIVLDCFLALFAENGEEHLLVMINDETARVQVEEQLRIANDDLEMQVAKRTHELTKSMEKVEKASNAKSEFLASMSHDLRTPLNAIMGFSEMMKEQTYGSIGNSHYEQYARDIHTSGKQLVSLINGILDLSKIEAGKYELTDTPLNVGSLIQDSFEINAPVAERKNIQFTHSSDPDIPMLYADERPITQILNNLISNAIKFTPEGGSAAVSAKVGVSGALTVQIEDNGIGMSRKEIAKATEPFDHAESSMPKKHEGTGLGLYICGNLMNLLGGTLDIDSEKNKGTKITLRFPQERNVTA